MRVALTVASLASEHGGPSRTVPALAKALWDHGVSAEIIVPSRSPQQSPSRGSTSNTNEHIYSLVELSSRGLAKSLRNHFVDCEIQIVHDNGVWLPANHASARASKAAACPLVLSPRGMLEPWSLQHHSWKKRVAWRLYQRRDVARASVIHATSMMEADNLRSLGIRQPIAIIPNGVDIPDHGTPDHQPDRTERTVLFLSRLHPKKGLLNLVSAWKQVSPTGWRAVVAGPDENDHQAQIQQAVRAAGLERSFSFVGPVDGGAKSRLYRHADLFVLPTFSENFGVVIAEALAHGLPVITTRGTPWKEMETEQCGWWIDIGVEPLANALQIAMSLSDAEREAMGSRGRRWVSRCFSWSGVALEMRAVYEWILTGGAPPAPIRLT